MAKQKIRDHEQRLCAEVGATIGRELYDVIPRVRGSLGRGQSQATFPAKCVFKEDSEGELTCTIECTEPTVLKLSKFGDQLGLYEGEGADDDATD